jgi:hypothetical protein
MDDLKKPTFWVLVVLTVLIAIVAVGNWRLYPRVETLEKKSRITGNRRLYSSSARNLPCVPFGAESKYVSRSLSDRRLI